jgi:hypothetical protein
MRTNVYFENLNVRHHSVGQSVGRNIILNWMLKEAFVMVWFWIQCACDRIQLAFEFKMARKFCEHEDELSGA